MPPGDRIEDSQADDLAKWVSNGAVWPAQSDTKVPVVAGTGYQITPQQRSFWSFQPIRQNTAPKARLASWSHNPIDAFILAKLDEKGLVPSPRASKLALIRRATFDLTGLPPSPA